jgi:hypothetical protein
MMRGNVRHGWASRPNRRWTACVSAVDQIEVQRELHFISRCHCCVSDAGVRINTRRTRRRIRSSVRTKPGAHQGALAGKAAFPLACAQVLP